MVGTGRRTTAETPSPISPQIPSGGQVRWMWMLSASARPVNDPTHPTVRARVGVTVSAASRRRPPKAARPCAARVSRVSVARRAWAWGGSLTLIPDGDRSGRCDSQKSNLISSHLVCVCARARMLRITAITVHSSSWTPEAKKKKEHRRPVSLVSLSIDEQLPPQHWEVEIPSRCTPCCWSEMPRA